MHLKVLCVTRTGTCMVILSKSEWMVWTQWATWRTEFGHWSGEIVGTRVQIIKGPTRSSPWIHTSKPLGAGQTLFYGNRKRARALQRLRGHLKKLDSDHGQIGRGPSGESRAQVNETFPCCSLPAESGQLDDNEALMIPKLLRNKGLRERALPTRRTSWQIRRVRVLATPNAPIPINRAWRDGWRQIDATWVH